MGSKKCNRCGSSGPFHRDRTKKDGLSTLCKSCKLASNRRWQENNREKVREDQRRWYEENRDHVIKRVARWKKKNPKKVRKYNRKYYRKWRKANRKKARESVRRWRQDNREKELKNRRRAYRANPEKYRKKSRRWQKANPEKRRANQNRYRARLVDSDGSYTAKEFKRLCNHYGNRCLKCGRDDVDLTADHVVPLSRGGSNNIANIQPLCGSCNSSKGTDMTDYRTKPRAKRWIQPRLIEFSEDSLDAPHSRPA